MSAGTPSGRMLRALVHFALAPLALAAAALLVIGRDMSWSLAVIIALLYGAGLVTARRDLGRWVLVLCSIALCLWPEVGLRALGFRWNDAGHIVFGAGVPDGTITAERDPDLFWALPSDRPGVNSNGFVGGEFVIPKPRGVRRIVFFGDSCTQQGFPRLVRDILEERGARVGSVDAVNLGVAGYSSHQGRVVGERWAARLQPDTSVVYFGWNDHWQAVAYTDRERAGGGVRRLVDAFSASRTFQLAVWLRGTKRPTASGRVRVSLDEYRENLERLGQTVLDAGSEILLLTAPSAQARQGVPQELIESGMAVSEESVLELHDAYNDAVRSLARSRGWPLLDLAAEADALPGSAGIFMRDGIHFTPKGLRWVASRIATALEEPGAS